jgi:predicted Fe-Mo cluster-binding NifX family protein
MTTRLAFPTDDGQTISRHFGQAKYFRVISLETGQAAGSELTEKASHQHGDHSYLTEIHPGQQMIESVSECQMVVCGGMGTPAYDRATTSGWMVILTKELSIESVVQAYLSGTLENESRLVHVH